jgi:hypothetical protein
MRKVRPTGSRPVGSRGKVQGQMASISKTDRDGQLLDERLGRLARVQARGWVRDAGRSRRDSGECIAAAARRIDCAEWPMRLRAIALAELLKIGQDARGRH